MFAADPFLACVCVYTYVHVHKSIFKAGCVRLINVRRVFVVYASGEAKLSELLELAGFSMSLYPFISPSSPWPPAVGRVACTYFLTSSLLFFFYDYYYYYISCVGGEMVF